MQTTLQNVYAYIGTLQTGLQRIVFYVKKMQTALQYMAGFTKQKSVQQVILILSDYFLAHVGENNFYQKGCFKIQQKIVEF